MTLMKWVASVSAGLGICLGAHLAHAFNFPNGKPAPVAAPKSLEEPPDDQPQKVQREVAPSHDPDKNFSLTFSPLHLILPMFQVTGEVKVTPHLGLSLIAGYGSITVEQPSSDGVSTDKFSAAALSVGGRLACYSRKFDGFVGGVQTLYVHLDGTGTASSTAFAGAASGLAVGPFIGYKWTAQSGFTLLAHLGVQYLAVRSSANDGNGQSASDNQDNISLLANLEIGWSF
ncbi:MAG TPA: hypothetical protein VIK01_11120 [Polyangiaceae bacterium]